MSKPGKSSLHRLSDLLHKTLTEAFAKQGFASSELVTRWPEIAGAEIAEHAQPEKIQWPRSRPGNRAEPGTLVLRVEGPMALDIQHLSGVILERVNRFFGWQAVATLRLRQAPLRRGRTRRSPAPDPEAAARVAAGLNAIENEDLRAALGRLGAAVKDS